MSICRAHKRTPPKYSRNASNALRVPTAPQTHESLCCSGAVDIQDDTRLQRCCGTASWLQLADSWKRLIFNQVQCHLWKTTDSVSGVFKCRHRGREHWRAGYLRLKIAVLTARARTTTTADNVVTITYRVVSDHVALTFSYPPPADHLQTLSCRLLYLPCTHPFNGPFSGTNQVSRYQKGKTNLDFTDARDSEWQWHQLGHMQVCTLLQTDNRASTPPLSFLQVGCPSCRPTNSIKALKAMYLPCIWVIFHPHSVLPV